MNINKSSLYSSPRAFKKISIALKRHIYDLEIDYKSRLVLRTAPSLNPQVFQDTLGSSAQDTLLPVMHVLGQ